MELIQTLLENKRVSLLNLTAEKAAEAKQEIFADDLFYTNNADPVWLEVLALVNLCAEMGLIGELKTLMKGKGI